jgi:hypothetical protein
MLRMIAALVAVACSGSVAVALTAKLPVTPGAVYCDDTTDVSEDGIGSVEFSCEPLTMEGDGKASVRCSYGDPEDPTFGPDWTMRVTIVEDVEAGTLSLTDDQGGDFGVLARCD